MSTVTNDESLDPPLDEFNVVYSTLRSDIDHLAGLERDANGELRYSDVAALEGADRRFLVRSVFAFIEAMAYQLKQISLHENESARSAHKLVRRRVASSDMASSSLSAPEKAICAEEAYELSANGNVELRQARLRFLPNLRFAFRIAAKSERVEFSLDVSGAGWEAVVTGARVRDRLMHPKGASDLLVSDDEIRRCLFAFTWTERQIHRFLEAVNAKLRHENEDLKQKLKTLEGVSSTGGQK